MAEDFVKIPPDSPEPTGKKLRTERLTVGANEVHQEVHTLASAAGNKAEVDAAGNVQVDIAAASVTVPVSAAALPLPTGAATAANQLPNSHDVTVDNAAGGAAVNIQDGGNTITVDATNLDVRDLTHVSDSVQIGDGTRLATVRDTGASDSLNVAIVDAAGNQIVSFGGGTGVSHTDDATFTVGTDDVVPVAGIYRTVRDTVTDNDAGALAMTERRALLASLETPAGDSAMDDVNDAVRVNVVTGAAAGTEYAEDTPSGAGDIGVFALAKRQDAPAADTDTDGDRARMTVDASNRLWTNGSSVTQPISAAALPLPTGAATSALQLPNSHDVTVDNGAAGAAVNIQDGGNVITVDATNLDIRDLTHVSDSVQIGDGTRTATVRDTGTSDSLNVSIVDASGNQITSFGGSGGTQYAEDTAAGDGDIGTLALARRRDTPTADVDTDGDRARLTVDALNRLWTNPSSVTQPVSAASLPLPTGAATSANQLPDGHNVTVDNGAAGAAVNIQDGGNVITVDATNLDIRDLSSASDSVTVAGAVTVSGTVDTELTTADLDTAGGTDTRAVVGLVGSASGGGQLIPGTAASGLLVDLGANNDVTVTGSVTVSATNLDIRDLTHVSDSVTIGDGTLTATVRDTGTSDSLNVAIVDAAGNQITSFGGSGGVSHVDDAAFAVGTDDVVPVAGIYRTTRDTVTDNDAGALAMTERRALLTSIETPAGDSAMDDTNDAVKTTLVTALPAGTNNIGDVDVASIAAGDNNIGNVDIVTMPAITGTVAVSSVTPGAAAGNLGKVEDGGHTSGDTGVFMLAIRSDTRGAAGAIPGTDLDYGGLQLNASGDLRVDGSAVTQPVSAASLPLPSGAATSANQTTIIGHLDGVESLLATIDADTGTIAGAVAGTEMQVDVVAALPAGNNNIGDVDVASIVPGFAATNLGKREDDAHSSLDVGVMALAVSNEGNAARAADNDYVPIATDTEGNVRLVGNRDHDAADAGEVVKVGGVAVSGSATPTSVASGDRTRFIANQHGIPYMLGGHPNLITREYDFGASAQTDVNLAAAVVAADERIYVTRFEALNDNATTATGVSVRAGFGTANVPTASATGVSGMIGTHPGLAPGSGIMCGTGAGIIAVGAAGEEPRLTSSAATAGNLHVLISYFLVDETP